MRPEAGDGETVFPEEVFVPRAGSPAYTVVDVRAPVETGRGALPDAVNIPILEDDERHRVGIAYKESGQDAAVELGFRITAEDMPRRVARWREACESGSAVIACWRGGLRSRLAQSFIGEPRVPRVAGGYKALRAHLLQGMERSLAEDRVLVVSGMTGTGKTELLESLRNAPTLLALDLEGHAGHRGSAFGAVGAQPAQQTFENAVAARLLLDPSRMVLVEDESRRIGRVQVPAALYERMTAAGLLVLEAPLDERIARIHRDYVVGAVARQGPGRAFAALSEGTRRLRKRLGGELTDRLLQVLEDVRADRTWDRAEALEPFIRPLLESYYDPLYRRAVERLDRPVLARGDREELRSWLLS